jgi:hypothetical protein
VIFGKVAMAYNVKKMGINDFISRSETFGFDTKDKWGYSAIKLLFNTPRCYKPLLDSWEEVYPGTRKAVNKLESNGFLDFQDRVIVNTINGELCNEESKVVTRWVLSSKGNKLLTDALIDTRVLDDTFKHLTPANNRGLLALIASLDLKGSHAKYGVSSNYIAISTTLAERTTRYWVKRLYEEGYINLLNNKFPDTREVIPQHWRINKKFTKQLNEVYQAFPEAKIDLQRLRLHRNKYLQDIDPARVGITGATDYDHDVEVQKIMASFLKSSFYDISSDLQIEPRHTLVLNSDEYPMLFSERGNYNVFYQPDSSFKEYHNGVRHHTSLEYERYQSRRDAWSHIEKFIGLSEVNNLPFEPAVLRFVVDSKSRVRSYVRLIEAFADYILEHPDRMSRCDVILAVTSTDVIYQSEDSLDFKQWYRVKLGRSETISRAVLHNTDDSPYLNYFQDGDIGRDQ